MHTPEIDAGQEKSSSQRDIKKIIAILLILAATLTLLYWFAYTKNTAAIDWYYSYYPAAKALTEGRSPYENNPYFFAPAWALIPIVPFVLLPYDTGRALFFVVSLLGFSYLGYKLGSKPLGLIGLLLSAPVANCIQTGNIEWIPLLGIFMPAPIGLVFLSMKPQSTIGIILFIMLETTKNGLLKTIQAIMPTAVLFFISWMIYGAWFLKTRDIFATGGSFIVSAWPYGIPIGLGLLLLAYKRREILLAIAASPLLSPYAILLTWSGFMLSLVHSTKWIILASIGSWVFWVIFRLLRG